MKKLMKVGAVLLLGALTGIVPLRAVDLGEYQIILDKQLLGSVRQVTPPAVAPPVNVPAPAWSQNYRMTMMTQDGRDGSIRVGLQNLQDQTSLLLIEGKDRYEDFALVSANITQGSAQISYKGVSHRFDLQSGPGVTRREPAGRNTPETRQSSSPRTPSTRSSSSPRTSGRNRGEEKPTLQIRRFASREELQEHLKQQQMDAIRTGKPPLPIPLTPEMDQQLVQEGVLPPQPSGE